MLICKNCQTENADDTQVCYKCKMKGSQNFIYVAIKQPLFGDNASSASPVLVATCWNCSKPSGDGEKCAHCHIKLKKKEVSKPIAVKKNTGSKATEETEPSPSTESVAAKRSAKKMP